MPQEFTSYCPQCLLVVFAAMGFYQYVMRDRLLNGSDADDELLDMDIDEMDETTQLMLLNMLADDHKASVTTPVDLRQDETARSA